MTVFDEHGPRKRFRVATGSGIGTLRGGFLRCPVRVKTSRPGLKCHILM
ncbi:MAG: hypothetical protein WCX63_08160 [Methanoregula sp.]